ncbi:MAG: AAA family ATPase, partial [Succinivibrio sp.]|nr:AAA family ATPase [Succinivibrio sp.]
MANYLNPGNSDFAESLKTKPYVDKTPLLALLNPLIATKNKYVCISRPRRFGKSVTAEMLCAYYGQEDSAELFAPLQIAQDESYRTHLNQYHVIFINMNDEFSRCHHNLEELKSWLGEIIGRELKQLYPEIKYSKDGDLNLELQDACAYGKRQFVVIIDEWDCVMREKAPDADIKTYLDFLEGLFKGKSYIALAYLTGILPIKKYGKHSAINMFDEYSVTEPGDFAPYLGFTKEEVTTLCTDYSMSCEEMSQWYDGYTLGEAEHIYNTNSVVSALRRKKFSSYWTRTETWEALAAYLKLNHQGLKDEIVKLLAGETVRVDVSTFENDMTTFKSRDDVLTLLTHLGYLSAEPDNFGDPD